MSEQNIDPNQKLKDSIAKLASSYINLSDDDKKSFEAQIGSITNKLDERTRKLYSSLVLSIKSGLGLEATIMEMEKADEEFKGNTKG